MDIASVGASGAYVPSAPQAAGGVQAVEREQPRPVEATGDEASRVVVNAQGQQTGKVINTTA